MLFAQVKKFVFRSFLLLALTVFFIEALHKTVTLLDQKNAFTAALAEKHSRAASLPSPKILLVGGSGVLFCYNSALLEQLTGLPVVNTALLAPLGMRFILSDIEKYVSKGDYVLASFEYDNNKLEGDLDTQLGVADFLPETRGLIRFPSDPVERLKAEVRHRLFSFWKIPMLLENPTVEDPYSIYFRKAFNSHGDIISHENNFPRGVQSGGEKILPFNLSEETEYLNAFAGRIRDKGAVIFYNYPAVPSGYCDDAREAFDRLQTGFAANLRVPVLSEPESNCYPDSLFFDSYFHLKAEARDLHTRKVAAGLLKLITRDPR